MQSLHQDVCGISNANWEANVRFNLHGQPRNYSNEFLIPQITASVVLQHKSCENKSRSDFQSTDDRFPFISFGAF